LELNQPNKDEYGLGVTLVFALLDRLTAKIGRHDTDAMTA